MAIGLMLINISIEFFFEIRDLSHHKLPITWNFNKINVKNIKYYIYPTKKWKLKWSKEKIKTTHPAMEKGKFFRVLNRC
jgi:hypothetical protein